MPQIVAFRAVRPDGSPADVQGYLLNGGNDTVARFRSEHDGMGRFLLTPRESESYRAGRVPRYAFRLRFPSGCA